MEQEINQQQFSQPEQKSGEKMKNLIFVGATSSILSALIVGGIVYFALNNSNTEKQTQLNNQISTLQNKISILESQDKTTQSSTAVTQDQAVNADSIPTYKNNSAVTTCDFWKDRIYGNVYTDIEGNDAAGTLSIKGRVIQRVEDASWVENQKVTKMYLVFSNPTNNSQQVFYNHYVARAQGGNAVNRVDGQQLLFKLGIKENSGLTTSASISNELRSRLISLIDKTDTIQLKLTIPIYPGRGVGDEFSFACEVSE